VAIDLRDVSEVDVEPGELPKTMAAWVIRQEREGQPRDAFQVEEIEVPEPGAFEVIVRVMAAGVNYNNVWAALGDRVEGRRRRDAVEARRRGGGALQPGLL
jgi:crotonyl-CoA carboxylase/reductase